MADDFSGLGAQGFERLCLAVGIHVLGPGLKVFGDGPDGGREASFEGQLRYPSVESPWSGFGVVQAKYKAKPQGTSADATWLIARVKAELDAWADPDKRRVRDGRRPKYLIFTTNVALSAVPGSGGKDRVDKLIQERAESIGLEGWCVWDATQLSTFLDSYPDVRRSFSALITSNEVLAAMYDQLTKPPETNVIVSMPSVPIRPGQPGQEAAFLPVYAAAGGESKLGVALGEVYETVPGWVQHFSGPTGGEPAVICALYGSPTIALTESVWNALCAVGGNTAGGGVAGAGLPIAGQPGSPFLEESTAAVELGGGTWGRTGRGRLVQREPGQWRWEPFIEFDSEAISDRDARTRDGDMDLRLRVAARISMVASELRVNGRGRKRMLESLAASGLGQMLKQLADRYDLIGGVEWQETAEPEGTNNSAYGAYKLVFTGTHGRTAIIAYAWFALPPGYSTGLRSVIDLRIDFDAIKPALVSTGPVDVPVELRVRLAELIDFFVCGWEVTTAVLPLLATPEPLDRVPAGAPRLELHITNERPELMGKPRTVRTLEMVDLSRFGQPRRSSLRDLSVGVTAPLGLSRSDIETNVKRGVIRMVEDYGFTDVDETEFIDIGGD
jgi:hypothetical protein